MAFIKTPVSLDNVKSGFAPIPAGSYTVRVTDITMAKSQAGNDYLKFEFDVAEGDYAGRKIWGNYSLKETALWRLREALEAFGTSWSEDGFNTEDLIGAEAVASISIDETGQKPQNRIDDLVAA